MDDIDLRSVVRDRIDSAVNYQDEELTEFRIKATDYYLGEPFGDEEEGRSQVVMTEVRDTIEAIMPSLMRIFTQSDDVVRFRPRGPEDVKGAEQKTEYVNYIVQSDNQGFVLLHSAIKDALLYKVGVLKAWWNESEDVVEEEYTGLSLAQLSLLIEDEDVEIVEQAEFPGPEEVLFDVRIKRTERDGRVQIDSIPPEEFLIDSRAKSLEDATFVAHRSSVPVSDLIAMGYDPEIVEKHAGSSSDTENEDELTTRFQDIESSSDYSNERSDKAMREVMVNECYLYVDYDGDNYAELRRVVGLGEGFEIVENESVAYKPFALFSPILMPHRAIGLSVAEFVMDLQRIKSVLWRQCLDNLYQQTHARMAAVEGQVVMDDLLTLRPGGVVRESAPGMVRPLEVPLVAQQVFPALKALDEVKEARTGITQASQGLNADALQSTTAMAVSAQVSAAQSKIEMIARVIAETGMRDLFRLILKLVTQHQSRPRVIRLRNEFVEVDPRSWESDYDVDIQVGLGNGDVQQKTAALAQIAAKQEQTIMQYGPGNPLVSVAQLRHTYAKLTELAGFKDVSQFWQEVPADWQPPPPPPNPDVQKAQMEMQMKQQELQMKQQAAQADVALDRWKAEQDANLKQWQAQKDLELEAWKAQVKAALEGRELAIEASLEVEKIKTGAPGGNGNVRNPGGM